MDQKLAIGGIIAIAAILIVIAVLLGGQPTVQTPGGQVPVGGPVTVSFMGYSITLQPVQGKDVPCIGAPPGYTRVFFEESNGEMTVAYYKQGNDLEGVTNWAKNAAGNCGYSKDDETTISLPGVNGKTISFVSNEGDVYFSIGVLTGSDGKEYTIVHVSYYKPAETEVQEGQGSGGTTEGSTEVTPTGNAAEVDAVIRPALEKVFGEGVKLTGMVDTSAYGTGIMLEYGLPRAVKQEDISEVSSAIVSLGWQQVVSETSGSHVTQVFMKEAQYLGIEYDIGGNVLIVTLGLGG